MKFGIGSKNHYIKMQYLLNRLVYQSPSSTGTYIIIKLKNINFFFLIIK